VDHAVAVDISQGFGNAQNDFDHPLRRQFLFGVQYLAQQLSIDPFHDHVNLAAVVVPVHLHDAGVVEFFADILFAAKTVEKDRIGFHFRVWDFDGDGAARVEIGAALNGGHAAASGQAIDAIVIELFAGADGKPQSACVGQKNSRLPILQRSR
jgi:hypothetical protein